jgi:colanic acid/amylovoran biosynthesis glycosyltransferase
VKVAYLTSQYPKTSHTFIRREITAVEAAGVEVERISVRATTEPLVDERDREERRRTHVLLAHGALGLLPDVLAVSLTRPWRMLRALRQACALGWGHSRGLLRHLAYLAEACALLRWTSRRGVEHVHVHFCSNPVDVALLCRELGGPPYSFTAHGTADLQSAGATSLPRKIDRARFAVAVCDDGLRKLTGWSPKGHEHKLRVLRCGIDSEFLDTNAPGVPATPRLVCVARLSHEKGIDVLLRAAGRLSDEGLVFELRLLGDGPERARLERLAKALGITERVRFEGWKSGGEVHAELLQSRALVLASHSEGLPIVIMEALALRRPVIATDVGGIGELVVTGVCGWLVSPGCERALADAMRAALTLPGAELDAMGLRGAQRVIAAHDASKQARAMAQLLSDSREDQANYSGNTVIQAIH